MAVIVIITIMFSIANRCLIIRRVYVESVEHYVDDVIQHSIDVQVTIDLLPRENTFLVAMFDQYFRPACYFESYCSWKCC